MQKAQKAVRTGQYLRPMYFRIVQSMEIRVHSRLILARYKGCTSARCILSRSYGHEELKNASPFSVRKAHKAVRTRKYLRPMHRCKCAVMAIRVQSRPILARYKGCTNARCILSRIYGHEEFKNASHFSVQKAHKAASPASPCSAVNGNLRAFAANPSSVQSCTIARCILSRSYGHEEFKNANPFLLQKAHNATRTCRYLRPLYRRIVLSMEIRIDFVTNPSSVQSCTIARCILSRSYGHEEFKNANPFSLQKAHNATRTCRYLCPLYRRIVPSM